MSTVRRGGGPSPFDRARPRRIRRAAAVVGGLCLVAVLATAWLDRSEVRRLDLGPAAAVTVENTAGPIEVVERDGPVVVEASASWLATGPRVEQGADADGAAVRFSCPGWGPCRAAVTVLVPPGTALQASAPDDTVSVGAFTGELSVVADDGPVALGPVSGPVRISTGSGEVRATDLRSGQVTVETGTAPVEMSFGVIPRQVHITSRTGPVDLVVPATVYRLDLRGDPLEVGGLEPAPSASRSLTVHGGGRVSLATGSPAR